MLSDLSIPWAVLRFDTILTHRKIDLPDTAVFTINLGLTTQVQLFKCKSNAEKEGRGTLRLTLHILYLNYFYCQYICHRNKAGTVATHHFSWKQQNWWCSKMWLLFTESSWIMLFLLSSFFKLLTALFLHCILNFCSRLFKFRRWDVDDGSQSSRSRLFKVLYRWQLDLIQLLEEDVSPLIQVSTSVLATASVLSILGLQSHILNSIIGVHICQRCYIHW